MNPFNSAWQLLTINKRWLVPKRENTVEEHLRDYDNLDWTYGDGWDNEPIDVDPRKNPAFDEEDLMDDATLGHEIREMQRNLGFPEPADDPEDIEEKEREEELKQHIADYLQSQKLASQPMDLAWRMLRINNTK